MEQLLKEFHEITDLREIRILKRNILFPEITVPSTPFDRYRYDIKITNEVDSRDNIITKDISVLLVTVQNPPIPLADIRIKFLFHVKGLRMRMQSPTKDYDKHLNEWLDNVILATTRGIMYAEFRGTFLDRAILPISDPTQIKQI